MPSLRPLEGRVAIVTGASRGIGRECVLGLAKAGCNVVIVAKSAEAAPNLPGTIFTVAREAEAMGVQAMPYQLDLRDADKCEECVKAVVGRFGRVDVLVNNASALWWHKIWDTPIKKYDLITSINTRGAFAMTRACLPHMMKGEFGRVVTMSPPIMTDPAAFDAKTAYYISKMGMTMVALGAAAEGRGHNVTGNSLWPATVVESYAAINFQLGESKHWRKATILADCVVRLACEPASFSGNMLVDDEYLRANHGFGDEELKRYRFDPDVEPPRLLAPGAEGWDSGAAADFTRGDVRQVEADRARSKL